MALVLAVNNGAFAGLAFVGVNAQSNASASTTPAVSLDQSTTKFVPPTSTYPAHTYINGDLNAQNSAYREGDCVPFRAQLTNLDAAATQEQVVIQYEHFRAGNYGYWSIGNFAVDLGSDGTIDSVAITTSPLPDPNATDADQTVTVSFAPAGNTSATLYWCGVLAIPANGHGGISSISGAPVHMRVLSGAQTVGGVNTAYSVGNQDRSIQPAGVLPFATLSITKSGPATATLGTPFSYTITVSNSGTGPQAGVSVSDTVPTGLTINGTPTSTLGTCSVSAQVVTCTLGTVNAGVTATITINVTPTLAACGTVNNHGTLTPGAVDSNIVSTTVNCPNVSILKTGSAAVSAGGTATFTITVTAGGTGDSTNVTVSDTLPTGTWTLGGANASSCSIAAGVLSCSFGTMANGSTRTVTLSRATTAADCNGLSNTATVSAAVDASTANNSSTASITVNCGNIGLTKTADSNGTVTAGSQIGYVITATNSGAGTATAVTVTDTLPTNAGLSWSIDAAGSTTGCAIALGVLTCNFGDLAAGTSAHVHLTSPTTAASCGTVTNSAHVATGNDGNANAGPTTITVNCPNVSILKTGSAAVSAGGTATFTITVTAGGTGDSTNVTVSDTLPTGTWTLGGANASSCSIAAGVLSCSFGTMANGSTRTVTLSRATTAADCNGLSNTATVSAAVDASTANNSSTASITVNCGNIGLTKTADSNGTVTAGSQIGYVITATNSGAGTATAVTVTDTLPTNAGLSWSIDAAGSTTGCAIALGVLTCNFGDLAAGTSAHVHLTSPTTAASCGTVTNSAHVATGNDGNANAGPTTITVNCPNVSILKTAGQAISAGGTASFTITVTAGGTGDSTQVMLTDALATGRTWSVTGADAEACTITPGLLSCDFGTMTNGSTRTVTLSTMSTSADCPEGLTNTALVSAAVDVNLENDSSTATQTVNCGQISLTKTADNATVAAGNPIGFVITATNNGAGTATSATVSDTLPTTAGTSWSIDAAGSTAGCAIAANVLTCNFGDLAAGASAHVHLTSPTTTASCGTVTNSATVRTGNDGTSEATASVTVTCPPPPPAPLFGGILVTKYNDTNRNGARDAGEPGLQGFVFTVKSGGTTVATLTSDANGTAASVTLSAGTYTVTETQQTGWTSTDPGTSLTKTVTVNTGQTTTVLFGNAIVALPPTSAGTLVVAKYNDLNANKTRDANEPALSGWTFTVKDGSGATVSSAATDANGNAIFQNLGFGTYTVTETLQSGWTSTDPGGVTPTKTVTISAASTTVLFGNAQIKLPNTSTLEAPPTSPSPAMLFLLAVLIGQGLLLTLVFRRWRKD